jgi:hypothetical protein
MGLLDKLNPWPTVKDELPKGVTLADASTPSVPDGIDGAHVAAATLDAVQQEQPNGAPTA